MPLPFLLLHSWAGLAAKRVCVLEDSVARGSRGTLPERAQGMWGGRICAWSPFLWLGLLISNQTANHAMIT